MEKKREKYQKRRWSFNKKTKPRLNTGQVVLLLCFCSICAGTLFLTSSAFVATEVAPKWFCFTFLLPAIVAVCIFAPRVQADKLPVVVCICFIVAATCVIQALYGVLQYIGVCASSSGFRVVGSFDNPAGFAASLCAGFPFLLVFVSDRRVWIKWLSIAAGLIIITAIILSASRAGMLGLLVVGVFALLYRFSIGSKLKIVIVAVLLAAAAGLYF